MLKLEGSVKGLVEAIVSDNMEFGKNNTRCGCKSHEFSS